MISGLTLGREDTIFVCGWTMTVGGSDILPYIVRYVG
jgi:hypothetical protein